MDIVLGTDDENIYLVYDNGQIADGFPFTASNDFRLAPVIVEVNGEKFIAVGNRDNLFYAINSDGSQRFAIETGDDISTSAGILETENGPKEAKRKMKAKNAEFIVLNHANEEGAGFESNTNRVQIFSKSGNEKELKKDRKDRIAKRIFDFVILDKNR